MARPALSRTGCGSAGPNACAATAAIPKPCGSWRLTRPLKLIQAAIPAEHIAFLRGFDDTFRAGDYLFVHAGIRPGIPLAEQAPSDLRWIREPFLTDAAEHGFLVVHGHTIRENVEERTNRIGIDTGAYRHGVLTALALEGDARWFLQASGDPQTFMGELAEPREFIRIGRS